MPDTISAMTVSTFLDGSKEFVQRIHEQKIAERERKKRFNIFDVLRYIRKDENFHSDIIAYLLNPSQRHGLGNKPLELFIP